jgi:small neutral amino acid transporter SnatA (MarC family)
VRELGLSNGDVFALLFLGMGPTRVALAFLAISGTLTGAQRRYVALRTTISGFVLVAALVLVGGGTVQAYSARVETVLIGSGLVVVVMTLAQVVRPPVPRPPEPDFDFRSYSTSPLSVPTMINPVGVTLVFAASISAADAGERFTFLGLVVVMLLINLAAMLLVPFIARWLAVPVLRVVQEVFALLTVALGVRMILEGLNGYGVITLNTR